MSQTPPDSDSDLPKLAAPARRALKSAGISRLEHFNRFTEEEIKELHGIGPNALEQLRAALTEKSLSFAHDKTSKA